MFGVFGLYLSQPKRHLSASNQVQSRHDLVNGRTSGEFVETAEVEVMVRRRGRGITVE
ncbi:hypothetical protein A2U01_0015422, partial [Trifolium medium]|nr:hypothetical protein [Trifolium medium]